MPYLLRYSTYINTVFTFCDQCANASDGEALLVYLFFTSIVTIYSFTVLGVILQFCLSILEKSKLLRLRHIVFESTTCLRLGLLYLGQLNGGTVLTNLDW